MGSQCLLQTLLSGDLRDEFDLGGRQVDGRRHHGQCLGFRRLLLHARNGLVLQQHFVCSRDARMVIHPECRAGIALRIKIHHQDLETATGKRCRNVDRRGGFTYATLLIGDDDSAGLRRRR